MAGTFTHWMVVEEALDIYSRLRRKHKYFNRILRRNHFVNLGAVGPDYPYLTDLLAGMLKIHTWADRMHHENTGEFLKLATSNLLKRKGEEFNTCLSWLCGFVSHVIADAVIHPIVNTIVGPYIFNQVEHRHCEMIQDSYIFREIKRTELRYSDYVGLLKQCSDPADEERIHPFIRKFWEEILKSNYPGGEKYFNRILPDEWHENFLSKISIAADPIPVFRHFGEEMSLVYKRVENIDQEEKERFIDNVMLPGGKTGNFRKNVFNKAVDKVINVWRTLFIDLERKDQSGFDACIKNWNLDTGVDEDNIHFWS